MFDHVTIRASNGEASKQFYETVLAPLEVEQHLGAGWTALRVADVRASTRFYTSIAPGPGSSSGRAVSTARS